MQITLKQPELETAVRQYIQSMGISFPVGTVSFTPTRGNDGIVTEIELGSPAAAAVPMSKQFAPVTLAPQQNVMAEVAEALGETPEADCPLEAIAPTTKKLFG
jgi:hypothetical protein